MIFECPSQPAINGSSRRRYKSLAATCLMAGRAFRSRVVCHSDDSNLEHRLLAAEPTSEPADRLPSRGSMLESTTMPSSCQVRVLALARNNLAVAREVPVPPENVRSTRL